MTICFFDRCNLVHMYGAIDARLHNTYDCIHVAYSDIEYEILIHQYGVPEKRIVHFKNELRKYLNNNYTCNDFALIDDVIVKATDGRFNLNLSIQADRGLVYKTYEESEKLIASLYGFWTDFFEKFQPTIIFHEMVSLSINHLCAVVAKTKGIIYASEIQVPGLHENDLLFCDYWGGEPLILKQTKKNDYLEEKTNKYISDFKSRPQKVLMSSLFKNKPAIQYLRLAVRKYFFIRKHRNDYPCIEDYIENFISRDDTVIRKYKNLREYKRIKWDSYDDSKKYYYFPFHLEPEAAVFFWGDGIYANQIKLIENIAASLPSDTYLYVKDHPNDIGYRSAEDYLELKKINNIKLLHAKDSSYEIIKNSKGVITINGSAGLEALLLDKPVFYFGNPYYEHFNNAYKIRNIKDLRTKLTEENPILSNNDNFNRLFAASFEGNTALFYTSNYDDKENLNNVITSFNSYISSIKGQK